MSRIIARAETWERVYTSFQNVNFAAFDYNTIKQSLLDYIKLYFPETFNDYIESSELVAIIEVFAYIAEILAYRIDVSAHENFITTAQRKDSVLRLAKLVSYTASRQLPARGLVKITSVSTTEPVIDTSGNNLANQTIRWNDVSNPGWKDQFILLMNKVLEQNFGTVSPTDRFQLQDVLFEMYSWNLVPLTTSVFTYTANVNGITIPMELVPIVYDSKTGISERRPVNKANFTLLYGQDGLGDTSDMTGFFCFTKQGTLQRFRTTFDGITPNQTYDINMDNVNDTDVWINNIDPATGDILDIPSILPYRRETTSGKSGEWVEVDLAHAQNIIFNTNPRRNKYETETRINNRVRLIFGDGEFADIPSGTFDIWARSSIDQDLLIPQTSISNKQSSFSYIDAYGRTQTFTFTFSLVNSLQNASASEDIEHIRATAPAVYYSQDRMVNGEDYNTFMLQDPSILKLRAINRTFAGDSKYITWHDPSGTYENVKMFSDDGILYYQDVDNTVTTPVVSDDVLITMFIEPILSSMGMYVQLASVGVTLSAFKTTFNVDERARIVTALAPPPAPVQVLMYFNTFTYEWHAIKASDNPNTLPGWPAHYITTPLLQVNQRTIFEQSYDITHKSRRLVMQSSTTSFWNTNDGSKTIDYDTLQSDTDKIVILQANVNNNRTGILKNDLKLNVVGHDIIEAGPDAGLPDNSKLIVLPQDINNDGVPDLLDYTDIYSQNGLANVFNPKYTIQIPTIQTNSNIDITLPIYFTIDPSTNVTNDVKITINGIVVPPISSSVEYWKASAFTGTFVSNKITIFSTIYFAVPGATELTIEINDYVYFHRLAMTDYWQPAATTPETLTSYVNDVIANTNLWKRHIGRTGLNFSWFHKAARYHLIDPAPSNIIDIFVITKGYYTALRRWLEKSLSIRPSPPSPLDLRNTYNYLLSNKMVSDTVVLHPGTVKLLFGPNAPAPLQATFKVVRSADQTLTDNQIKTIIVTTIRNFFDITLWEFGETFYFTELAAAIHTALPTEINSVVLVPNLNTNQFGDLFQVLAREDEVLYPDVTVDDIEIVPGYTPTNLKLL